MARYVDIECSAVTEVIGRKAFKNREDIQDFLDNIPTADVEPVKHGHWIDRTIWWGGLGQARRECSCCGTIFKGRAFSRKSGIGFKYCEECGAKMERENNDR